jgi:nitrite reductase/ring-hydroxylating ferredoxin subunit
VARDEQVVEGTPLAVEVGGRELALFRLGGEIRAIDNVCPHSGGPLALGSVSEGIVACPWHGWTFDIQSGRGVSHPECRARAYATRVENGQVLVQLGAVAATESP